MDYTCLHWRADLDEGDILEHFYQNMNTTRKQKKLLDYMDGPKQIKYILIELSLCELQWIFNILYVLIVKNTTLYRKKVTKSEFKRCINILYNIKYLFY